MESGRLATDTALESIYETGSYSDMTIVCGPHILKVHRAIVLPKSAFFERAFKKVWREGHDSTITLEAIEHGHHDLDVSKDDPEAIKCMVDFLYLHRYETEGAGTGVCSGQLCLHAKVFALSDKYGIPSLAHAALEAFENRVSTAWMDASFVHAVSIAFTTSPEDSRLRDKIVTTILQHGKDLTKDDAMETAIRHIDGLAYQLWKQSMSAVCAPVCMECGTSSVKECPICAKRYKKSKFQRPSKVCFVSCDCEDAPTKCPSHLGEMDPPEEWPFE